MYQCLWERAVALLKVMIRNEWPDSKFPIYLCEITFRLRDSLPISRDHDTELPEWKERVERGSVSSGLRFWACRKTKSAIQSFFFPFAGYFWILKLPKCKEGSRTIPEISQTVQ